MRALTLVGDRKIELLDVAAPPAPACRRSADRHQGDRTQSHRRLGLARHGVRQAQAAAHRRRGGGRRDRRRRPRRDHVQSRRPRRRLWRADLRHMQSLPRGPRQSLRKRRQHHGLPCRRFRPRSDQHAGAAGGADSAGRQLPRRRLRAGRVRHRAAHAVRQCQARAGRNHFGAGRRLRHRHLRHQNGEGDRRHRHHHGRRRRQGGKGQGARRRSRHQLPHRALRNHRAQAYRQEGRRCRLRACRSRHVQRLAALPQARRTAGDLRLDHGAVDHHEPVPALFAAISHLRLVRLLDAQYPREPRQDGVGPARR